MNKVGIIQDPRYLEHITGLHHPERPERLLAIRKMLEDSALLKKCVSLEARSASEDEIALIHTRELIDKIKESAGKPSTFLDGDTHASEHSWEAAQFAVGGLLAASDELLAGKLDAAFAFPRPPGHHAERDHAMGFCLFNNVAIAAEYILKKSNLKKILILDFDVHHGNGTQHIFEKRSDVFYLSMHQYPFYPGTGAAAERGKGAGEGYTLNIPLHAGSDDAIYQRCFQELVEPAVTAYQPNFLIISAGFDAHIKDPLGGMEVSKWGFREMANSIQRMKKACSDIPLLYALEGGYNLEGLSESVKEVLEVMLNP